MTPGSARKAGWGRSRTAKKSRLSTAECTSIVDGLKLIYFTKVCLRWRPAFFRCHQTDSLALHESWTVGSGWKSGQSLKMTSPELGGYAAFCESACRPTVRLSEIRLIWILSQHHCAMARSGAALSCLGKVMSYVGKLGISSKTSQFDCCSEKLQWCRSGLWRKHTSLGRSSRRI